MTLVTDDPNYRDWMIKEILKSDAWDPKFESPHFITEWKGFGPSYFDTLWRELGRKINYLDFGKKNGSEKHS